jgi:hypothetical protein
MRNANKIAIVKETAKPIALRLVADGYTDAGEAVRCPRCSQTYLLLFLCQPEDQFGKAEALPGGKNQLAFVELLRTDHFNGHRADYLIIPHQLR